MNGDLEKRQYARRRAFSFASPATALPNNPHEAIGGSTMARYFFQANYRGVTVLDEIGEDFPTVQEAEAHAVAVAKELGHNNPQPVTVLVLSQEGGPARAQRAGE
jgi:Domain of unknown function (DUF6894)